MSKKEILDTILSNEQILIDMKKIFNKCQTGYGTITDMDATIFIYCTTLYFMNILLDENSINKTKGSIVSDEEVKNGLNFNNTIAAVTTMNNEYTFEYSEYLKNILKEKSMVSFIFVTSAIGHEMFHIYQRQNIENKVYSIETLIDSLEFISRIQEEEYYEKNYNELHFEITAELAGIYLSISLIEKLINRKLNKIEISYIKELFIEHNPKQLHKFDNEEDTFNYLRNLILNVKGYIKLNKDLLTTFPVVRTIFDKNGNVRSMEDMIKLKYGIVNFNLARENDINKLYKYVFNAGKIDNKIYINKK